MTPPRRSVGLFLVERYLPVVDLDDLFASVSFAARVCDERRRVGATLRYLHSTYVPGDETCFCLFEAESAQDVNVLNADVGFRIDRISPAVSLDTRHDSSSTTRRQFVDNQRKKLP